MKVKLEGDWEKSAEKLLGSKEQDVAWDGTVFHNSDLLIVTLHLMLVWWCEGLKEMSETCRKTAGGRKDSRLLRRPEVERHLVERER